jgi:hypothetical protein
MNCTEVRAALPALLYGDLPAERASALRAHVAGCPGCRAEYGALERVKGVLDALPTPAVRVDLPQLYQDAARWQTLRLRRWRRAALVCLGAAAALLLVLGLKLEVRVEAQQFVVRWGAPPPAPGPAPEPPPAAPNPAAAPIGAEDVYLVKQLIHALADDSAARDRRHADAILWLQNRLDALQRQSQERWTATERYVSALYTLNANLARKE